MTGEQRLVIRTGCLACRARGVRCDPNNGGCQRSTSTEWRSNRSLVQKGQRTDLPDAKSAAASLRTMRMHLAWEGTSRERQSLHFFSIITAPELSGLLDARFWQLLILQATLADQAIFHAVAAIGAIHEHRHRKQTSQASAETNGLHLFALKQCNKAITKLVSSGKKTARYDSMRTVTASVLFACFESLSGNETGATTHVVHSKRLLRQHDIQRHAGARCKHLESFPVDMETIEPLVAHYEVRFGSSTAERKGLTDTVNLDGALIFTRLADARISLEKAISGLSQVIWDLESDHSPAAVSVIAHERSRYSAWFQTWECAFTAFLAQESTRLDSETLNGCRLLKAHHLAASILAGADYTLGETAWARVSKEFSIIVELLDGILILLPKRPVTPDPPQTPYLTATMGMIEPLYLTATRCPDSGISGKAEVLLGKLPLSEGARSVWKTSIIETVLCTATGKHHLTPSDESVRDRA